MPLAGAIIPKNVNVRIIIQREVENTSEVANISEFVSAAHIQKSDVLARKINSESWNIKQERYKNFAYNNLFSKIVSTKLQNAKSVKLDYSIRFKEKAYTVKMTTESSRTNSEIRLNLSESFVLLGTQEFEMSVYVEDATNITNIRFGTNESNMIKAADKEIHTGWNKLRYYTEGAGAWSEDTATSTLRILVYHASGTETNVWIGDIVKINPPKANLIIIADGPYYTFYTEAYPTLKNMGVPVVWALDPTLLDAVDASERHLINENELELLAVDGISEFSFHSYDGTIMSSATSKQALFDTLNNIRYLRKKGIEPNHIWRAAWLQNNCAHPEIANQELEASASYNGSAGITFFPFPDKYNISRMSMAGTTQAQFDTLFNKLRLEHSTVLLYAHGVSEGSDKEITPAMLTYLIGKIQNAIDGGYLNPTTYSRMVEEYAEL